MYYRDFYNAVIRYAKSDKSADAIVKSHIIPVVEKYTGGKKFSLSDDVSDDIITDIYSYEFVTDVSELVEDCIEFLFHHEFENRHDASGAAFMLIDKLGFRDFVDEYSKLSDMALYGLSEDDVLLLMEDADSDDFYNLYELTRILLLEKDHIENTVANTLISKVATL